MSMFITFEGIEGSGKTSHIRKIAAMLGEKGYDCLLTREPGATDIGRQIRAILLNPDNRGLDPTAELLLYMADRAHHVATVIRPALAKGRPVICDRYVDATIAYQGYARGLDIGLLRQLHALVLNDLKPDMTILLDLPVEKGLERAWRQIDGGQRPDDETRFEREALAFHERVRRGYLDMARREPGRFRIIDSDRPADEVQADIRRILSLGM